MIHNEASMTTTLYQDLSHLWPMTIGSDSGQSSSSFPDPFGFNQLVASSSSSSSPPSYNDNASVDSSGFSSLGHTSTPSPPAIDFTTLPVLFCPPQESSSSSKTTSPKTSTTAVNDQENVDDLTKDAAADDHSTIQNATAEHQPNDDNDVTAEIGGDRNQIKSERAPRGNNYCETVAVESTAHVAQIVGKNGCRIKHLRAKFGTYIHTPSANDEPVFIIKGPREKVLEVKQEIIKADSHFGSIKEARNAKISKMIEARDATCIRLYVPDRYIGLVVGRNGWFVKELQLKHNIYIETPKFDLCSYFQLFGPHDRLLMVKQLIYDHIYQKTGINFLEKQETPGVFVIEG